MGITESFPYTTRLQDRDQHWRLPNYTFALKEQDIYHKGAQGGPSRQYLARNKRKIDTCNVWTRDETSRQVVASVNH